MKINIYIFVKYLDIYNNPLLDFGKKYIYNFIFYIFIFEILRMKINIYIFVKHL